MTDQHMNHAGGDVSNWLGSFTPPPPMDPKEVERLERQERESDARTVRDRLPPFVARARFDDLELRIKNEGMRTIAKTWNPRSNGNVLLLGETALGKTTAAALLCRRILQDGWRDGGPLWDLARGIQWFRAEVLEREMRAHPLGKGECRAYTAAISATILVIDELGWEHNEKAIASVLAARHDSPHQTIVTSGYDREQLASKYGQAVVRRMLEHGARAPWYVEAFPARDAAEAAKKAANRVGRPLPPGDQEELARRMGEKP